MLLAQRFHAFVGLCDFAGKILLDAFGAREAFSHCRKLFATGDHTLLQFLKIAAQVGELFGSLGGFGFGGCPDANRLRVLGSSLFGAGAGRFGFALEARDFFALAIELQVHAKEFTARFVALVGGGYQRLLRFHLLRSGGGKLHLTCRGFFLETGEVRLLLGGENFEAHGLGFALAKLAFEGERSGLAFAAARNGAAVIAGAVRSEEITVRIVVGHLLGDGDGFDDIGSAKLFQEIFRSRAERLAKLDEAVETRDEIPRHGSAIFHFVHIESAGRIHEEGGASTDIFAEQRDSGAGLIERFDDDVFELFAEKLLDRGFVFFLDFSVIREQAESAETARRRVTIGVEKLLHGVGRIGAFAQNLLDRGVPGTLSG